MAITGHTGVGEITNLVYPEEIRAEVYLAVEVPYIYDMVASVEDLRGRNTDTSVFPIRTRGAVAASLADGDEFTYTAAATTQTTATAARYAHARWVDERANRLSLHDEILVNLRLCVESCRLKMDTDVVGIGASATTDNGGSNATVLNYEELDAALTTFQSQAKESDMCHVVLHSSQQKDLRQAMLASQAALYSSIFGAQQAGDQIGKVGQGAMVGRLGQAMIHVSDRVPAADTSGKGGFICDDRALTIVDTLGFDPQIQQDYIRGRGWVVHCAVDYAVRINDQARILEVISRAA